MNVTKMMVAVAAAATFTLGTISCSKDDDAPVVPVSQLAVGSYTGDLSIAVMKSESVTKNVTYTIKATNENTISLTTPVAGEGPMSMPSITIEGLQVTKTTQKGVEVITATKKEVTGTLKVKGQDKSYTFQDLTVAVDPSTKKAVIGYSLKYGKMPMAMVAKFTGTAKK